MIETIDIKKEIFIAAFSKFFSLFTDLRDTYGTAFERNDVAVVSFAVAKLFLDHRSKYELPTDPESIRVFANVFSDLYKEEFIIHTATMNKSPMFNYHKFFSESINAAEMYMAGASARKGAAN